MTPPTPEEEEAAKALIQRLKSKDPLPICPYDRRSPDYWTTPDDEPCKLCGQINSMEAPDVCRGADTRVMDEAAEMIDRFLTALQAKGEVEAALLAENAELTKALTGLTCGGSEFFSRKGDRFVADIDACVSWVRRTKEDAHRRTVEAIKEKRALQASLDEARATLTAIRSWRQECHVYDDDTGLPRREFGDDDFRWIEAHAASALDRLSKGGEA